MATMLNLLLLAVLCGAGLAKDNLFLGKFRCFCGRTLSILVR